MNGTLTEVSRASNKSLSSSSPLLDPLPRSSSRQCASLSGNAPAARRQSSGWANMGNLHGAVTDLFKAHEISPEDETIVEALMDTQGKAAAEGGGVSNLPKGVVIEQVVEEDSSELSSTQRISSSTQYTVFQPHEGAGNSRGSINDPATATSFQNDMQESMRKSMEDPAMRQMFVSMMENMSPDVMAYISEQFGMKLLREGAAKAQ